MALFRAHKSQQKVYFGDLRAQQRGLTTWPVPPSGAKKISAAHVDGQADVPSTYRALTIVGFGEGVAGSNMWRGAPTGFRLRRAKVASFTAALRH